MLHNGLGRSGSPNKTKLLVWGCVGESRVNMDRQRTFPNQVPAVALEIAKEFSAQPLLGSGRALKVSSSFSGLLG